MAMGMQWRQAKQAWMWVATSDLLRSAGHPFYARLNQILDEHEFDRYVEGLCQRFYADDGRPGLPPGRYFRLLLIGYFEGLDADRAIAWRTADSFALREFLGLVLPDAPPDHSTISRTRRLIDLETHQSVFTWMLQRLADAGLVKGKTAGIDATTLEASAALRSIVRRDTGESNQDFLIKLAQASGIDTPTRADLARIDRKRKKKGSTTQPPYSTAKPCSDSTTARVSSVM
jgi:transposase